MRMFVHVFICLVFASDILLIIEVEETQFYMGRAISSWGPNFVNWGIFCQLGDFLPRRGSSRIFWTIFLLFAFCWANGSKETFMIKRNC